MKNRNVTFSIEQDLLNEAQAYARARQMSLNALLRELLRKTVRRSPRPDWVEDFIRCCDESGGNSRGRKWSRDELHER